MNARVLPLRGLKVLDLSKVLAGPLCGQYLGELGADVIKIEPPDSGDDTRAWLPQRDGVSATFMAVNHNKRSVAVDLKSEGGRAIVHKLAAEVDIVLQGFGGGTARKLQVDYETLRALNERLIYCEISGYGRTGPMGAEPGYDVMIQAFSGMISTMGTPGGDLARASFSPVDLGTGGNALSGILAAVIERGITGKGVYVEVSLLDTAMALMGYMAQNFWMTGRAPQRMGTAHPAMAPYQAFQASDGPIMLGVGNDAQWVRFCRVAELQEAVADPRFATNAARVENFDATVRMVADRMSSRTVQEWLERLRPAGVPCSAIHTLDQSLAHPQLTARELLVATQHPVLGEVQNMGIPVKFHGLPRSAQRHAPLLGEHTRMVLQEAGYTDAQIEAMCAAGTVQMTTEEQK